MCCLGFFYVGVLLNCWDYGLEREIGWFDDFEIVSRDDLLKFGIKLEDFYDIGIEIILEVKIK